MNKAESRAAVVLLAMVAACVAALVQGVREDNRTSRITSLRSWSLSGKPQVALFFGQALHLLDGDGRRTARQPLAELGLHEEPNDMDWVQAPDGSTQAWFFEDTPPRITRCTLDAAAGRLTQCAPVLEGAQLKANPGSRAMHLAVDGPRQRVYVADARGHVVQAFDANGQLLGRTAPGLVDYPNRLRVVDGTLIVADNDHRRLVWLDVAGAVPAFTLQRALSARAHPAAAGSATKVTDVALAEDGRTLWMLAVAQGQKYGQVLVFGERLRPLARADLGAGSDPLVIETLAGAALVADFGGVDLYRVGPRGELLGAWGGPVLRADLQNARNAARAAVRWTRAGWAGLALTVIVGLVLGFRLRDKPVAEAWPETLVAPDTIPQTLALEPTAWAESRRRTAKWVLCLLLLLLVAGGTLLWLRLGAQLSNPKVLFLMVPNFLLVVVCTVWLGWELWRSDRLEVVVEDDEIGVRRRGQWIARAPIGQVLASPQILLVQHFPLAYRQHDMRKREDRWAYDKALFTRGVLARLAPAQWRTVWKMQFTMLWRMRWWQKAVWAGIALLAVAPVLLPR